MAKRPGLRSDGNSPQKARARVPAPSTSATLVLSRGAVPLHRRAWDRAVRTEYAAIPWLRLEASPATLTVVKEQAGVLRHSFGRLMPAVGACDGRSGDQLGWLRGLRGAVPPPPHKRKDHKRDRRYEHGNEHVIELCNEGGQAECAEQDSKHRRYATQQRQYCAPHARPDELGILVHDQPVRAVVSGCSKAARIAHPSTGRVSSTQSAMRRSSALHIVRIERILLSSCCFFSIARLRTSPQRAASRPRKTRSSRISASVKPHCWACLMKRRRPVESLS